MHMRILVYALSLALFCVICAGGSRPGMLTPFRPVGDGGLLSLYPGVLHVHA
jgi:hypothetical protein